MILPPAHHAHQRQSERPGNSTRTAYGVAETRQVDFIIKFIVKAIYFLGTAMSLSDPGSQSFTLTRLIYISFTGGIRVRE